MMETPSHYCCEICGQEGLTDDEMRTHMLLVHIEGAISCPFCDLSDISADEMLLHVNGAHLDFLSPDDGRPGRRPIFEDNYCDALPSLTDAELCCGPQVVSNKRFSRNLNETSERDGVASSPRRPRSMLTLDLSKTTAGTCPTDPNYDEDDFSVAVSNCYASGLVVSCPICGHRESSPTRLEEHVNRSHFDLTSPSFPAVVGSPADQTKSTVAAAAAAAGDFFDCPLCSRRFASVADLELHVNVEHILSPARPPVTADASPISWCVVGEDENANQRCPVCDLDGVFRSSIEMAKHIEDHFKINPKIASPGSRDPMESIAVAMSSDLRLAREIECQENEARRSRECQDFQKLKAQYGMDGRGSFHDQSLANMQRAVYNGEMSVADFYNRQVQLKAAEINGIDDGHSCTKGTMPRIRAIALNCRVAAVWLCTTVDHYSTTYGDRGWGCGYRNIQMMLSSLMHHTGYNEKLFNGQNSIPSISKIQELIEWSWRQGFDSQGCEQLGGTLSNTRKWIGATEVVSFLASFRIRCQLVDFHCPTGPDGSHPELFRWVTDYFQKPEDFKAPIYLQHQGHSRTIVGVEQLKDGCLRLLVFDPSHSRRQMEAFSDTTTAANGMRLIRRPLAAMKARQYQVVTVAGIVDSEREFKQNKILLTVRIPRDV